VLAKGSTQHQDAHPGTDRFDELFANWVIANYLDDHRLAGGRYGYKSLQLGQPRHAAHHTGYPVDERATVHQYATDYVLLEGEGDLTISFEGDSVTPLVGNRAHGGQHQWWSNRGDEGDTTLTRAFDLTGLETANLRTWMWYDLETDFDYAYVQVSPDGGQTWQLLANEHTTITNPHGNSYGPAFTGISGSDEEAQWVQETFDLTPYAGGPILIRFEVITDEALNRPGFCLDDISIPELGYTHDVEHGADGWQAEGWAPVTDHVPQGFVVQLITFGRQTFVEPMALDAQMRGTLVLNGLGRDIDHAVLAVSAMAPATTESTTYSYQITQE
jgi:immune inhibitor A